MNFEWDEHKRQKNIKKHGIDFLDILQVFEGYTLTLEDTRFDYDEERLTTFGLLKNHVVCVVHTEMEDTIRLISARKASKNESKYFFKESEIFKN